MNFADALDAALERGTYESPRVPRSTATFTSRHANPFLYSALGVPFAQRRVFSQQNPSGSESAPSRECTARTSTAFGFTRAAWQPEASRRDLREHERMEHGAAAHNEARNHVRSGQPIDAAQPDAAPSGHGAAMGDGRNAEAGFDESSRCDSATGPLRDRAKTTSESLPPRARMLTVTERQALDTLVRHGARLTPAFSVSELRREYRRLARRLHPDAHPDSTVDERAQLSARFAAVSSSYQVLAAGQ